MARRTKIVATIGPASDQPESLERLIAAGVDVVRLNLSHGSVDEHLVRLERVRSAAVETRSPGRRAGGSARPEDPDRPIPGGRRHVVGGRVRRSCEPETDSATPARSGSITTR